MLNTATEAPIPSASVRVAAAVNAGVWAKERRP